MQHTPDFEEFARLAQEADLVPVYRQLLADTLTPVSAYCKLQWGPCSFLFESVVGGEKVGRYSFLGSDPFLQLDAYGRKVVLTEDGRRTEYEVDDPLDELQKKLEGFRRCTCRACRGFAAARWAMRVTMSSATPNTCRIRPRTIGTCPICRFRFTTGW